jgi:hypothetical protein
MNRFTLYSPPVHYYKIQFPRRDHDIVGYILNEPTEFGYVVYPSLNDADSNTNSIGILPINNSFVDELLMDNLVILYTGLQNGEKRDPSQLEQSGKLFGIKTRTFDTETAKNIRKHMAEQWKSILNDPYQMFTNDMIQEINDRNDDVDRSATISIADVNHQFKIWYTCKFPSLNIPIQSTIIAELSRWWGSEPDEDGIWYGLEFRNTLKEIVNETDQDMGKEGNCRDKGKEEDISMDTNSDSIYNLFMEEMIQETDSCNWITVSTIYSAFNTWYSKKYPSEKIPLSSETIEKLSYCFKISFGQFSEPDALGFCCGIKLRETDPDKLIDQQLVLESRIEELKRLPYARMQKASHPIYVLATSELHYLEQKLYRFLMNNGLKDTIMAPETAEPNVETLRKRSAMFKSEIRELKRRQRILETETDRMTAILRDQEDIEMFWRM